ncbi:uncharacterized protein LOC124444549 [Xenia sp. Carnegie-2017]|uniref:uncharacterized protein LOC124444549 n=1 Tax=Xenia sp. Carnegie-2017 TaxID=2897299 RepID=UPI001F0439BA|nr:uncharacterized protein LOC124444549 [Xenia sp. Carnegie-2017]
MPKTYKFLSRIKNIVQVLKLQIFHPYIDISNSTIATCIQDNIMTRQVLMERVNYSDGTNLIVSLRDVLKDSVHNYLFDLVLYFHLDGLSFVVCTFKIKVFQIDVESGEISQDEISVRFKKQLSTGPHKGRKQRLEDKARSKFVRT